MIGLENIIDNVRLNNDNNIKQKMNSNEKRAGFQEKLEEALKIEKSGKTAQKVNDKKLMDVCIEMESIFVAKMFKEMRKSVQKNKWIHGGFAEEIFEDMLYDQYAINLSKNSNLGIGIQMYDELSRK